MKSMINWFAHNGVVANLLMFVIIALGLMAVTGVNQEVFPTFEAELISVAVPYRGAAPEEVEQAVCIRIEEAIQGLEGVKRMTSTAAEGAGSVLIEVETGYDIRELLDDIKARVDAISTFPIETEKPVVQELLPRLQVINVSLYGDADELTLKRIGEQFRDDLTALPEISQADLKSIRPYEVSIEVSEDALRRHGLTFDEVTRAVRRSSLDMPGGSVKADSGEILLRTKGQAYNGEEFEDLTLLTRADGTRLRLVDVARVVDGFQETDQWSRFDGQPTVMIQVYRVGDEDTPDVAAAVHRFVAQVRPTLPPGISIDTWQDSSVRLGERRDLLVRNGINGLLLVFIVLTLFLRMRLALWVAVGIPVAFLGAFATMPYTGITINMMTLFAFILVLGIVVDDAIIVAERIHYRQDELGGGFKGAIAGTQEVAIPVIFGVLTTMVAFSPFMMVPGLIGNFTRAIPLIVIPVLAFSVIESQFVLPYHLSRHRERPPTHKKNILMRAWDGFFVGFAKGVDWFTRSIYRPVLEAALGWRYLTAALGISSLFLVAGLIQGGVVEFVFFPQMDSDNVMVKLTMPQETPADITATAVENIEATVLELGAELEQQHGFPLFTHVLSSVGEQPSSNAGPGNPGIAPSRSYLGEVNVELVSGEGRPYSSAQITSMLRERLDPIPGAVELELVSNLMGGAGKPIDFQMAGPDIEELRIVAADIRRRLTEYPGVTDITDSFRGGKPEIELALRPSAESLGLSLEDLGRQVRQGFFGEEAQRIQRGRDDVRVMVRYPEEERQSLGYLENMRIRTPEGAQVPFLTVADASFGRGFSSITRVDRRRAINVSAGVDEDMANANAILFDFQARHMPEVLAEHPNVTYSLEGEQRMQGEFMEGLFRGFFVALFVIFALMAIPFKSYSQPLIVMSAVPFGLVGAVFGHAMLGMTMNFMSMMGMVAVAGVVVNDSLVLVHFINRTRKPGESPTEAVRDSGVARFRPILLTSLTTAAGVTPLMLETSIQAQFLIPMAVSLASGVLFATLVTLALVPALYLILEDLKNLFGFRGHVVAVQEPALEPGASGD
jgi:multidrug efflux pump subunit AcrB